MQCAVYGVQCAVISWQSAVCSVQCAVCSDQSAECRVQCAVCSDQLAECSVQCEVYNMKCLIANVKGSVLCKWAVLSTSRQFLPQAPKALQILAGQTDPVLLVCKKYVSLT